MALAVRGWQLDMLRIITGQRGDTFHLELHGSITGEWIAVLERHWRGLHPTAAMGSVTVDLSNVAFIDADGERLLRRMVDAGVRFGGHGLMTRYVIDKVSGGA